MTTAEILNTITAATTVATAAARGLAAAINVADVPAATATVLLAEDGTFHAAARDLAAAINVALTAADELGALAANVALTTARRNSVHHVADGVWVALKATPTLSVIADAARQAVTAFDNLATAADKAISRSRNQREVRRMIALAADLDAAADRLNVKFGRLGSAVMGTAWILVEKALAPTSREALLADAKAAEAAADAAIAAINSGKAAEEAALLCEEAAGAWGVLGDQMRTKLWLDRAKSQQWFSTDFE